MINQEPNKTFTIASLKTAKFISDLTQMTPKRLIQLAQDGFLPHTIVDGKILFHKPTVLSYIKKHFSEDIEPTILPPKVCFYYSADTKRVNHQTLPKQLMNYHDEILDYSIHMVPPCIYFLVRDIEIMYVGQTVCLPGRVSQHVKEKPHFNKVYYFPVPKENLLEIERKVILEMEPPWNNESYLKAKRSRKINGNQPHTKNPKESS